MTATVFEEGLLRYLTPAQLQHIQSIKIGIAGCGGLGSNIAHALVRTGFIHFEIIDKDIIEASNLNRQNYYSDEVGLAKVTTTAKRLNQINSNVQVKTTQVFLTSDNIHTYFQDCTILFEAFDNVESKALFLETFADSGKLLILGSGMAGIKNTGIPIEKIRENIYIVGDRTTAVGKDNPPLAPRVIACASLMASVAVEHVLN